jgi:hypothetical protein
MNLVIFNVRNQEVDTIPDRNTKRVPVVIIVIAKLGEGDHGAIDTHKAFYLMIKRVIDPAIMKTSVGVHPMKDNRGEQPMGPLHERRVL